MPGDVEKIAANLAAIIAMKVLIDGGEHPQSSDEPDFRHSEYTIVGSPSPV